MKIDTQLIRADSLAKIPLMGFKTPPEHYPLIDAGELRSLKEIQNRALALNVIINVAYGMPIDYAKDWLATNNIACLTPYESDFLQRVNDSEVHDENDVKILVEALWILVWVLGFVKELDFNSYCEDSLSKYLPDLREFESSQKFTENSTLRRSNEIYQALDMAYCISWSLAESNLTGLEPPGKLRQYVYWERRRALEWLRGGDWDDPSFST